MNIPFYSEPRGKTWKFRLEEWAPNQQINKNLCQRTFTTQIHVPGNEKRRTVPWKTGKVSRISESVPGPKFSIFFFCVVLQLMEKTKKRNRLLDPFFRRVEALNGRERKFAERKRFPWRKSHNWIMRTDRQVNRERGSNTRCWRHDLWKTSHRQKRSLVCFTTRYVHTLNPLYSVGNLSSWRDKEKTGRCTCRTHVGISENERRTKYIFFNI